MFIYLPLHTFMSFALVVWFYCGALFVESILRIWKETMNLSDLL